LLYGLLIAGRMGSRSSSIKWSSARVGGVNGLCGMRGSALLVLEILILYAAKYGHLELLRWALDNGCPWDAETRPRAGLGGHLELLKWARAKGCPWERALLFSARSLARAAKITFDRWSSAAARALRRVLYSLRARTASLCARVFQRDEHRDR
jgi:hypothetical protein